MNAPAGWSHGKWRWEYRPKAGGEVTAFFHDIRICELGWDELRDLSAGLTGGVPIPAEARPSEGQRLEVIARYAGG